MRLEDADVVSDLLKEHAALEQAYDAARDGAEASITVHNNDRRFKPVVSVAIDRSILKTYIENRCLIIRDQLQTYGVIYGATS